METIAMSSRSHQPTGGRRRRLVTYSGIPPLAYQREMAGVGGGAGFMRLMRFKPQTFIHPVLDEPYAQVKTGLPGRRVRLIRAARQEVGRPASSDSPVTPTGWLAVLCGRLHDFEAARPHCRL